MSAVHLHDVDRMRRIVGACGVRPHPRKYATALTNDLALVTCRRCLKSCRARHIRTEQWRAEREGGGS